PRNAFMLFRSSLIEQGIPSHISDSHKILSKVAGLAWRKLSEAEREPWRTQADNRKAEYLIKYPGFVFQPGKKKANARQENSTYGPCRFGAV
ncbi:hypothetical protein B0H11DRAFT_1702929, partial [Mycena galericulata]